MRRHDRGEKLTDMFSFHALKNTPHHIFAFLINVATLSKNWERSNRRGKILSYITLKIKESLKLVQGLITTACMEGYQITSYLFSSAPNCGLIHFSPVMKPFIMVHVS